MYLKLEHVSKHYGQTCVFDDVNFELSRCGLYFLSGESGSGKTTLLNMIAGYEKMKGKREVSDDLSIACIFQSYELIEELNVKDNILLHQDVFDINDHDYTDMIISTLGLQDLLAHYPKELSGGQKQRVGIARALLLHPNMIICDEPTESLDIENKEKVMNLLKKLSLEIIVIVASHEENLLKDYYDYHYRIVNKNIECIDKRIQAQECQTLIHHETLNKKKVHHYLGKIINKSTIIYSLILGFILLATLLFSQINTQFFKEREHRSSFNEDVVYINIEQLEKEEFEKIMNLNMIQNKYVQIPFTVWNYKGKTYNPKIFPYISNIQEIEVIGSLPNSEGIVINQYVAKKIKEDIDCEEKDLIGKEIELNYVISQRKYPLNFKIIGIVYEEDVNGKLNIYYDYKYVSNILKSKEYTNDTSQYDYLLDYGKDYVIQGSHEVTGENLYNFFKNKSVDVYHSIYSHLSDLSHQQQMYELVFSIIQVILIILTFIYILFYVIKDTRKNKNFLSILISLHIPMKLLKQEYFIKKVSYILLVMIPIISEVLIYRYLCNDIYIMNQLYYVGLSILIYIILLIILLYHFKEYHVSSILKDNKD